MQKLSPYELPLNAFQAIGKQWAMITTQRGDTVNTMTASWGGVGILWNKPVTYVFLRPQRFTRELLDGSELFSVCFLPEDYRKQLSYCGAHSGRDGDKLASRRRARACPVADGANLPQAVLPAARSGRFYRYVPRRRQLSAKGLSFSVCIRDSRRLPFLSHTPGTPAFLEKAEFT